MNIEEAYQWLHGDRVEYSGCRAAAETYNAALAAEREISAKLEKALKMISDNGPSDDMDGAYIIADEALAEVAAIRNNKDN